MLADYTTLVFRDYQKKKADNALPLAFMRLTPAGLRQVCLTVCNERYNRKDERTLKAFFGQGDDKGTFLQAIDRCDIDKFRPLIKFLKGATGGTDYKNIELLAWLIDFKGRPCEYDKEYKADQPENPGIGQEDPQNKDIKEITDPGIEPSDPSGKQNETSQIGSRHTVFNSKVKMGIVVVILLIVISIGIYWLRPNKFAAPPLTGREACMFWADNRYQPISCAQKLENVQIFALDSEKITHFQKITRPDTITLSAKGSVWYVKYRGNMEYYTSGGFHPIDPQLRLKPITDYIIRKYIHNEQVVEDSGK